MADEKQAGDVIFVEPGEAEAQQEYSKATVALIREIAGDASKSMLDDFTKQSVEVQSVLDKNHDMIAKQDKVNIDQQHEITLLQADRKKEIEKGKNQQVTLDSKIAENINLLTKIKLIESNIAELKKNTAMSSEITAIKADITALKMAIGDKDALEKIENIANILKSFGQSVSGI